MSDLVDCHFGPDECDWRCRMRNVQHSHIATVGSLMANRCRDVRMRGKKMEEYQLLKIGNRAIGWGRFSGKVINGVDQISDIAVHEKHLVQDKFVFNAVDTKPEIPGTYLDRHGDRVAIPTEPGFYHYSGGAQTMLFHLDGHGQWRVWTDLLIDNNEKCDWGYIEQALGVWGLVKI